MDTEISDWNVVDYLKTPEQRAAYIEAAAEEGTTYALPSAFADVFRAMGKRAEAAMCECLAAYLRSMAGKDVNAGRERAMV